ncbi:MAG TPA: acetyl-CoA carboxylase biotin carboxyl carrier protein [Flavisolibacter sp.]|jgi:acetyl-CoA carboxylase biotin carboxyl carrier protein
MDFKQIQELIKLVNDSNIGEVTLEQKDFKITIKQKEEQITQIVSSMQSAPSYQLPQQQFTQQQSLPQASGGGSPEPQPAAVGTTVTIKSPMIGTFYRRPAPDKPDFVKPGDAVAPGDVVCIIEAMKLFNEIESEIKGRIVKILVEDASPVEYDQPLFLVEPS